MEDVRKRNEETDVLVKKKKKGQSGGEKIREGKEEMKVKG